MAEDEHPRVHPHTSKRCGHKEKESFGNSFCTMPSLPLSLVVGNNKKRNHIHQNKNDTDTTIYIHMLTLYNNVAPAKVMLYIATKGGPL